MDLLSIVVRFALVVPAIVFHEVAHGYAALALGDRTAKDSGRLSLNPLKHIDPFGTVLLPLLMTAMLGFGFGYAKPVPVNPWRFRGNRRVGMAITGIAGPAANMAMALVGAGVARLMGFASGAVAEVVWTLAYAFCVVNLALMFFNLVPIPPFDGSRLLLPFLSNRGLAMYRDLERYGFVIVIALLWLPPQLFHVDLLGVYLDATVMPVLRFLTGVAQASLLYHVHVLVPVLRKASMAKRRVLTGYRPTGRLTLGHWFGNLLNMREMQEEYEAYYFVADWHALTSDWQDTSAVRRFTEEMVLDWLAAGIDPEKATIYRQSDVPEVAELTLYLSMVTPMSWLERVPSYKEQREQISDKDLGNVGFFLYPLMQAADITIVKADLVPVGEDQAPHLELTREIVRRFNGTYGELLVEPQAVIPKEGARVPGTDGRKMSKSYGNAIYLSESAEETTAKVRGMVTDPARKLKTDPGNPDICPLHQIHRLVGDPAVVAEFDRCCRVAECGCVAHKVKMAEDLNAYLAEFRERRAELAAQRNLAWDVLQAGAARIRPAIDELMGAVREAMHVDAPVLR